MHAAGTSDGDPVGRYKDLGSCWRLFAVFQLLYCCRLIPNGPSHLAERVLKLRVLSLPVFFLFFFVFVFIAAHGPTHFQCCRDLSSCAVCGYFVEEENLHHVSYFRSCPDVGHISECERSKGGCATRQYSYFAASHC